MHLESIHIYPVKSARGLTLDRAVVDARGLRWDRRWVLVDGEGSFVTQRELAALATLETALDDARLLLHRDGFGSLALPLTPSPDAARAQVVVWGDRCDAIDCGEPSAEWLSRAFSQPLRLLFMPDDSLRAVDPRYARDGDITSFSDGFPVLIATSASLSELQSHIAGEIPMNRFRPNLVIADSEPWEEDDWANVSIGSVPFRVVKPSARCVITTTDQLTGARGHEPLATLAKLRSVDHKVLFGQNAIPDASGWVAVGDRVEIKARRVNAT